MSEKQYTPEEIEEQYRKCDDVAEAIMEMLKPVHPTLTFSALVKLTKTYGEKLVATDETMCDTVIQMMAGSLQDVLKEAHKHHDDDVLTNALGKRGNVLSIHIKPFPQI